MSDENHAQTDPADDGDEAEQLAEDYLRRLRNGESPRLDSYIQQHPHLADELRELLGAVALMQEFDPNEPTEMSGPVTESNRPLQQLGAYRVIRELGRGGMGVVYEAEHSTMRRRVALKVLFPHMADRANVLERFHREARSAGRLHHTNIVPVFEVGSIDGHHFYSMQRIRGQNLDQVISEVRKLESKLDSTQVYRDGHANSASLCLLTGRYEVISHEEETPKSQKNTSAAPDHPDHDEDLTVDDTETSKSESLSEVGGRRDTYYHRAARIGLQVAEALAYAHDQGILHRDIKPANLILDPAGIVWVTDFGLARTQDDDLTMTGDILGTIRYMAPERFQGDADARSDIYSLGLTIYELCALRYAFHQEDRGELVRQVMHGQPANPRKVCPAIPRDLETIILKSIAREPSERYPDARRMAEDLRLFLSDRPIRARRSLYIEHGWRWCRRNPIMAITWFSIALMAAVIFVGSIWFSYRSQQLIADLESANAKSRQSLYEANFRSAQAERQNRLGGRQENCLEALAEASAALPDLRITPQERQERYLALRNEAIATLVQTSVATHRTYPQAKDEISHRLVFDFDHGQYIKSGREMELRSFPDGRVLQRMKHPLYRASEMVFSPDGQLLVTLHRSSQQSRDANLIRFWDFQSESSTIETKTDFHIRKLVVSADGKYIAARGDNKLVVFSTDDLNRPLATREFDQRCEDAAFLDDGRIAAVGYAGTVEIWQPATDESTSIPVPAKAGAVAFCHATKRLAVGLHSGEVQIHDLGEAGRGIVSLSGHHDTVYRVAISEDDRWVLSTSWDGTTRLWNSNTGLEVKRIENQVLQSEVGGQSRLFVCKGDDDTYTVFEITGRLSKQSYFGNRNLPYRRHVDFCPVNPDLIAVATSSHVELWNIASDALVGLIPTDRSFDVRFRSDGEQVLISGRHGLSRWALSGIRSSGLSDLSFEQVDQYEKGMTFQMDASKDLSRAVFVNVQNQACLMKFDETGKQIKLDTPWDVINVEMSPDGRWVALTPQLSRSVWIIDTDTGEKVANLEPKMIARYAFSPDSRWLLCNANGRRQLWSVGDWKLSVDQSRDTTFLGTAHYSPDGNTIVVSKDRFRLELLRASDLKRLAVLDNGQRLKPESIDFSPQGDKIGVALRGRFEIWDLTNIRHRLDELGLDWSDDE